MEFQFGVTVVGVNVLTPEALLTEVARRFRTHQGFALATINVDHLVKLRDDVSFRTAYTAHDLVSADGNPIVWLSHLAGRPVGLVPGSDMVAPLVRTAATCQVPIALVGATPEALAGAKTTFETEIPGAHIVAEISPPMGFDPESAQADQILDQVAASGARLCLIALGAPKQEKFAARGRARVPQVGFASIGASLDFLAGTQTRAPNWVRKFAMEWLWRLAQDPKRMGRRYFACGVILPRQVLAALKLRRRAKQT